MEIYTAVVALMTALFIGFAAGLTVALSVWVRTVNHIARDIK